MVVSFSLKLFLLTSFFFFLNLKCLLNIITSVPTQMQDNIAYANQGGNKKNWYPKHVFLSVKSIKSYVMSSMPSNIYFRYHHLRKFCKWVLKDSQDSGSFWRSTKTQSQNILKCLLQSCVWMSNIPFFCCCFPLDTNSGNICPHFVSN